MAGFEVIIYGRFWVIAEGWIFRGLSLKSDNEAYAVPHGPTETVRIMRS
jgi:hypothetical protein